MRNINCGSEKRDPDTVIREAWAESLGEYLAEWFDPIAGTRGMTRKQLQARLRELGYDVSLQSIGLWLAGKTAPRPSVQVAIGKALGAPARRVFPLEAVAS